MRSVTWCGISISPYGQGTKNVCAHHLRVRGPVQCSFIDRPSAVHVSRRRHPCPIFLSPSIASPSAMSSDAPDDYQASAPFEGPEKLLEIWFAPSAAQVPHLPAASGTKTGLRTVSRATWEEMLDIVKCKVLSVVEGTDMDAYLLRSVFLGWRCRCMLNEATASRPSSSLHTVSSSRPAAPPLISLACPVSSKSLPKRQT